MTFVQSLTLLASSNARWTTTQESLIVRDYPFTDIHLETPDQFVVRTYLQFLWLPESIMSLNLLVPSLRRVHDASSRSPDTPHPLHALLDPMLLSVRSVTTKYHTNIPRMLVQDGGGDEPEDSMMWYAFSYEIAETGGGSSDPHNEDAMMLEEKSRKMWLERLERREVQIQVLLYLLKLSLPGPCSPLPRVMIPANNVVPSATKNRQKQRSKFIVPSAHERLESFMDKLSMWQLVTNVSDSKKPANKDGRDWMQTFCENIVEPQFKSTLPDVCALLRRKLFPNSPFSDEDNDPSLKPSRPDSAHSRPNRKLARSSTTISQSKSKSNPKPIQRSSSVVSHTTASDARSRSRSLSVSLAHDASTRRSSSTSGTASSLKRALRREVSMSRGFKPRTQQSQASQLNGSSMKVPPKSKNEAKTEDKGSRGVTLVAATPTKPKIRADASNYRLASSKSQSQSRSQASSLCDDPSDTDDECLPGVKGEDEEQWLLSSSPEVPLLGPRKRATSGSSSSCGLSDWDELEGGVDTPVKKRLRI